MPDLRLDDDRLATVLASVGEHLVVDRAVDAAPLRRGHRPAVAATARRRRGSSP